MSRFRPLSAAVALAALYAVAGCHGHASGTVPTPQQVQAQRSEEASDRVLLDQIPPPAKSRYMAVHSRNDWQNPLIIVGKSTVTLRVMYPPPPQSSVLPGHLLQPTAARKRELELRLSDLPEALASVPQDSWPYGRVVAVEEDPTEGPTDRVQIRRNIEATINTLNNLGVVDYEWPYSK